MSRNVFVTVGTTQFDDLIKTVTQDNVLQTFIDLGYDNVTCQIGGGLYEPQKSDKININYYRLKPSIKEDIQSASLVISHAGAGSCFEILAENKPLIAVINENLMGNHQTELAEALCVRGYLQYCTCSNLQKTLLNRQYEQFKLYATGEPEKFATYLDKCVGFCS